MIPYIFKPEECFYDGFYHAISYGRKLGDEHNWKTPETDDIDDIEIYSDYGNGFYWQGKGSESVKYIISEINFGDCVFDYKDGKPQWVTDFYEALNREEEL